GRAVSAVRRHGEPASAGAPARARPRGAPIESVQRNPSADRTRSPWRAAHRGVLPVVRQSRHMGRMERGPALHRRPDALSRQRPRGLHRARARVDVARRLLGDAGALRRTRRDGLSFVPAGARHRVRERDGEELEPAHLQASARGGGQGVAPARVRARAVSRCGRARRKRALQQQARDRPDGEHQHHLRRRERLHRADPGEHLHAQDAFGLVHGQERGARTAARLEGARYAGDLAIDSRARRLRAASRRARRASEGGLPHRIRDRPALGDRARRGPRAEHLPGPVAEPLPAQRHPQMGPVDAALDRMGAGHQEPLLLPLEVRAARGLRRRRSRQHAPLAGAPTARRGRRQVRRMPGLPVRDTNMSTLDPQIELLARPGLMTPSTSYKPFRYPWAIDYWRRQQQIHWLPEEVPLGEDCKDWAMRLTDGERNLLTQVFRFFTQSDVEVQDNYLERYARVFRPTEIKMMLAAFANMETVHIVAYALLLETLGMPDSEFAAFMDYAAMRDKHDYMQRFGVANEADILRTLAMFGG